MEAVILKSCRTVHGLCRKVHVQCSPFAQRIHTAYMIYMLHGLGIVETAGTFRNGNMLNTLFSQPSYHRLYHQRVCSGWKIR